MLFVYTVVDKDGRKTEGTIEAISVDVAITGLQRRGFIISSIKSAEKKSLFEFDIMAMFARVKMKDVVILSRQMSTLFEAQVSALRIFRLLASEGSNLALRKHLEKVADDIQGGSSISNALAKHPQVFSDFYVNMVRSGEESGKLDETFMFLADYLDRSYEITSKAKNALVYPSFIVATFVIVMALMLTKVIPNITKILTESGQELPIYTKIVIGLSDFMINYGALLVIGAAVGGFFLVRYRRTDEGRLVTDHLLISVPYLGDLYQKLALARIADNIHTMVQSAIPIVKTLEVTSTVVGNAVYAKILKETVNSVKAGSSISQSFQKYPEMPGIMVQMIRVGEETGELANILSTMAKFYTREVTGAVDTLIGMIEPAMIILLAVGVGVLLASVLMPIYNLSSAF
jgi:type IV pilus assembly protein PilC